MVPIMVIRNVEAIMKYQLQTGRTVYPGSIICAAWVDMPANMGSLVPINRLALQPPDTPANAAARPAMGWRPKAMNRMAPKGTSTT